LQASSSRIQLNHLRIADGKSKEEVSMLTGAIAACIHYVAILLTAVALFAEFTLCRPALDAAQARLLVKVDILYFGSAIAVLVTGAARLLLSPQ
jgi:uncharacterized membrane protein